MILGLDDRGSAKGTHDGAKATEQGEEHSADPWLNHEYLHFLDVGLSLSCMA
jgi:hypothetical protein